MASIKEWKNHFRRKGKAYTKRQIALMMKIDSKVRDKLYVETLASILKSDLKYNSEKYIK